MRERGLKCDMRQNLDMMAAGRSREGAWIEIYIIQIRECWGDVAPVRERGLKCDKYTASAFLTLSLP